MDKINRKVNWLGECPNCGSTEHVIKTDSKPENSVNVGDDAFCSNCGMTGFVTTEDGDGVYIDWV